MTADAGGAGTGITGGGTGIDAGSGVHAGTGVDALASAVGAGGEDGTGGVIATGAGPCARPLGALALGAGPVRAAGGSTRGRAWNILSNSAIAAVNSAFSADLSSSGSFEGPSGSTCVRSAAALRISRSSRRVTVCSSGVTASAIQGSERDAGVSECVTGTSAGVTTTGGVEIGAE